MTKLSKSKLRGLDKKYVLAVLALERTISALTKQAATAMAKQVIKAARVNEIQDQDVLLDSLMKTLRAYFKALNSAILVASVSIAAVRAVQARQVYIPLLRKAKAFDDAAKLVNELSNFPDSVKKSFPYHRHGPDNNHYTGRIKSIQEGAEKTVRNIVANGMTDGLGAREIAKKIENYVILRPDQRPTRPFDEYRQRFQRPQSFKPNVRSGTIWSNALMVARTETAEMYRDATERLYKDKTWVKGYRWVLSNSHPKPDICDKFADHGVYKKDEKRPWSHPHCVCDWQAEPYSDEELDRMVKASKLS